MSEASALGDWSDEGCCDDFCEWTSYHLEDNLSKPKRSRKPTKSSANSVSAAASQRGVKVNMLCNCGVEYKARKADLLRGWGLSCSKSCAAKRRGFNLPSAKILGE